MGASETQITTTAHHLAVEHLLAARRVLIGAHVDPDGDTLGASLGLCLALRASGREAWVLCDHGIPSIVDTLPGQDALLVVSGGEAPSGLVWRDESSPVLGVALDAADRSRLGRCFPLLRGCPVLLNIDHHPTNPGYGDVNVVEPRSASTSEVVYAILKSSGLPIGLHVAQCIYTGVASDTGCFRYANTSPACLSVAAELVACGVNASAVAEALYERRSHGFMRMLGLFLSALQVSEDGALAWSSVDRATLDRLEVPDGELDGLVTYVRMVRGVEVALMFREVSGNAVKISLRSREMVDVGGLAQSLGGGGHARAAGATIAGTLESVQQTVISATRRAIDMARMAG